MVNLSSDASSGDNASMLEPTIKKRKVEKSSREELQDRRTRLDMHTQGTMVIKKKGKGKDKDKGKIVLSVNKDLIRGPKLVYLRVPETPRPSPTRTPYGTPQDLVVRNPSPNWNEIGKPTR